MTPWLFIIIVFIAAAVFVTGYGFGQMDAREKFLRDLRGRR